MLLDWYTPSHIVHGFLFYALLHFAAPRWPVERRFLVALLVEAAWEIFENTPMIIDRYREATIALGYSGDSILNSASDLLVMSLGFWAARRLPVWASVESGGTARTAAVVRDPRQPDTQHPDARRAERGGAGVAVGRLGVACLPVVEPISPWA